MKTSIAADSIAVEENVKGLGEMRISEVQTGRIMEDTILSTYSGTAAVPSEFLITPSKLSLMCNNKPSDTPTSKESSLVAHFSTPIYDKHHSCIDATCSVCLSPLLCRTALVETRCKHMFHEKCLLEAKSRKAECPNCRAALSPTQPALPDLDEGDIPQISIDYSSGLREAILARSSAARDAVRLGNVRREHEKRRSLVEATGRNNAMS